MVVNDDEIVKVHVHTEDPGPLCKKVSSMVVCQVKVDNMRNQLEAQVERKRAQQAGSRKEFAIIAVVAGDGLAEIFMAQGS